MSNSIEELILSWKNLVGEPRRQELYIKVNNELYKVKEVTIEDSRGILSRYENILYLRNK